MYTRKQVEILAKDTSSISGYIRKHKLIIDLVSIQFWKTWVTSFHND